jgi:hypothetical protein
MARLIFEKASITDAGTTTSTDDAANISGIVTDSITMSEEALQVIIEDNQNVNEGYTSTMSFRTRNLTADDDSTPILDSADSNALAYGGGSNTLSKKVLRMYGVNGGDDFYLDNVYVMGRRVFENGREEIEISAQIDSTSVQIVSA